MFSGCEISQPANAACKQNPVRDCNRGIPMGTAGMSAKAPFQP